MERPREIAERLVRFLSDGINNTLERTEWSDRNFDLLRAFARREKGTAYPSERGASEAERAKQFLWDFVIDLDGKGLLLVAESEFDNHDHALKQDFQKLFYARSPVKLMICRVTSERQAAEIKKSLESFMSEACSWFGPGEVYVLYCVWWALDDGQNRDIAYILEFSGQMDYRPITTERFEPFAPHTTH